jgi:stearoyl-CoA desaturase (delta-9 desaturase)
MTLAAGLALGATCATYFLSAGLAVGLAYHRMLAHRSLVLPRLMERLLVTLGLPAGTPVQWAGNHRRHHARADRPGDPHSPLDGFWHAHNGWYIGARHPLPCVLYALAGPVRILIDGWHRPRSNQQHSHLAPDVAADRYYAWVSRPGPYLAFAVLHLLVFFGGAALVWGPAGVAALWATLVAVFNLGDAVDSVGHVAGTRPYPQASRACNGRLLGWLTLGEGWHANHHRFPWSARHGILPGQPDGIDAAIRVLERLGVAREVRRVSAAEAARAVDRTSGHDPATRQRGRHAAA